MKTSLILALISLVLLAAFFGLVREDERYGYRGRAVIKPFYSDMVKDKFRVVVYLPKGYDENKGKKYPVIYQLDGSYYGKSTAILVSHYCYTKEMPGEAIVVAVGYYYDGFIDKRERDFLYVESTDPGVSSGAVFAGGGLKFYLFLKHELIPYVDGVFRTDNTVIGRTLMGHGMGGYFTVFALFDQFRYTRDNEKPLFSNFIAASPVIVNELGYLFFLESTIAPFYKGSFPVNLFIAASENEEPPLEKRFPILVERFKKWKFPGFRFKYVLFKKMQVTQTAIPTFKEGIRFTFSHIL